MRKTLSLLLALALCLGLCAFPAAADSDFVIENGVLTKYNGPGGYVTIPDGVTRIGDEAFKDQSNLLQARLPRSVTGIGRSAFEGCTSLVHMSWYDTVAEIGERAFYGCVYLVEVGLPDELSRMGRQAFGQCRNLMQVEFDVSFNSEASIDGTAFEGCPSLVVMGIEGSLAENYAKKHSLAFEELHWYGTSMTDEEWAEYHKHPHVSDFNLKESSVSVRAGESVTLHPVVTPADAVDGQVSWRVGDASVASVDANGRVTGLNAGLAIVRADCASYYTYCAVTVEPAAPAAPSAPAVITSSGIDPKSSGTAYPSTSTVNVDGKQVEFLMYALRGDDGAPTNYIKLRDLADALDGTKAQFNVGWDGSVNLEKGKPYTTRNGQEGSTPYSGDQPYTKCASATKVDGTAAALQAFTITDASGGGSNYFKLRDLGQALGFNVGWSADRGLFIETDKPYDPAD